MQKRTKIEMCLIVLYNRAKKGSFLEPFWRKAKKLKKQISIPYNSGLRFFSEKQSGSNNVRYCFLLSYKNLGRSLKQFWRKGQKSTVRTK